MADLCSINQRDYKKAIKALYALSGSQPLLPRWSLGNWWSRYHDYTAEEYTNLMDRFKDEGMPFNVAVIDMGWHWVDDKRVLEAGMSGWTGYSWNTNFFPDPKAFCKGLHDRGLKITLNGRPYLSIIVCRLLTCSSQIILRTE